MSQTLSQFNKGINLVNTVYKEFIHNIHIPIVHFDILYALCVEKRPLTQSELHTYLMSSKQSIHSAIHSLEAQGYVEIISKDKKKKYYALTEEGNKYCETTVMILVRSEAKALNSFSKEDREKFLVFNEIYSKELKKTLQEEIK